MAAGQGFKTFTTGEVLTASDTNGYLMQGVLVFADAAARTAAITSPQEGQMSYLKDTDSVESYSGSAWVAVGGSTAPSYFAGKNSIINGGMDIWQRGTSFTVASSTQTYTADRWMAYRTATGATVSQQTTSPNYSPFYTRVQRANGNTGTQVIYLTQAIESSNSKPLANKTVTLSWWARAGANFSAASSNMTWELAYGTGNDQNMITGFTGQTNITAGTKTLTTSWQQFTTTGTVSSTATQVGVNFYFTPVGTAGAADYMDIADVQLELGTAATTFARTGGTIQGELANCQRYYFRSRAGGGYAPLSGTKGAFSTTLVQIPVYFPVTMRTTPSSIEYSNLVVSDGANAIVPSNVVIGVVSPLLGAADATCTGLTQFRPYTYSDNSTSTGYIAFSAEL
jgi:hypothetical protein